MNENFSDLARRAFLFVEEGGFRCVRREPNFLRYESETVFLTLMWDRRSGEINEFVGLLPQNGKREDGISLSDLLSMEGADAPERKTPFQVANEGRLSPFLERLAADTKAFAGLALAGDRMYFRRLKTFRNAAAQAYMRGMTLQRVRSEAEKAWHSGELDKVIELYKSIESDLRESERNKLEYAQKKKARGA